MPTATPATAGTYQILVTNGATVLNVNEFANGYLIVTNPSGLGAPTTAQYWIGAANATLASAKNLGALLTGLVLNASGTPSAYGGTSCTNQFPRSLNSSGVASCASIALASDVSGTLGDSSLSANVALRNAANTFTNASGQAVYGLLDLSSNGAGQIQFPSTQHASADVHTLDFYEEGTWTPTITFGGNATGETFVLRVGRYTKIGNRVVVMARVLLSSKGSSTGTAKLVGLPFTSDASSGNAPPAAIWANNLAVTVANPMATITAASTTVDLYTFAAGVITGLDDTYFNNNSDISFSVTYEASQ